MRDTDLIKIIVFELCYSFFNLVILKKCQMGPPNYSTQLFSFKLFQNILYGINQS